MTATQTEAKTAARKAPAKGTPRKARPKTETVTRTKPETPAPAEEKAPRAPRPNAERRNETTHPDGAAAVAFKGCPSCKARKAKKCVKADGTETNHVHAARFKTWEAAQS